MSLSTFPRPKKGGTTDEDRAAGRFREAVAAWKEGTRPGAAPLRPAAAKHLVARVKTGARELCGCRADGGVDALVRALGALGTLSDEDAEFLASWPDGGDEARARLAASLDRLCACGFAGRTEGGWRCVWPEERVSPEGARFPTRDGVLAVLSARGEASLEELEEALFCDSPALTEFLRSSLRRLEEKGRCACADGIWRPGRATDRPRPTRKVVRQYLSLHGPLSEKELCAALSCREGTLSTLLADLARRHRALLVNGRWQAVEKKGRCRTPSPREGSVTTDRVLAALAGRMVREAELAADLCEGPEDERLLADIVEELRRSGRVALRKGRLRLRSLDPCFTGRYGLLPAGRAAVAPTGGDPGVVLPAKILLPRPLRGCWPGDEVEVQVPRFALSRYRTRHILPEGRFLRLVARTRQPLPVVLHASRRHWMATPLDPSLEGWYPVARVPGDVEDGETALALPPEGDPVTGEGSCTMTFHSRCGRLDTVAVQESLVKINQGVPTVFPDDVLEEARALPPEPAPEDLEGRRDLRQLPFVTIDGATARDFDDAIEVEQAGSGYILRVAIADVSHYVRPGSALDREALERGNSWYFPRSVEPMLPKELSDGLCSLCPDRDRLVMWADLRLDAAGEVLAADFGPGVIRSFARLTYDGVKAFLLDGDEAAIATFRAANPHAPQVLAMLGHALALSRILRRRRIARGSLMFDLPEAAPAFDDEGHVVALSRVESHEIHGLIEEFMIAANEAVARRLEAGGMDTLYRVHPAPTDEKMAALSRALALLGVEGREKDGAFDLRGVLAAAAGTGLAFTVNRLCVRSMQQARYERENVGHFGLASAAYCHFTSPIRRYADLLVHRGLKLLLGLDAGRVPVGARLERVASLVNASERRSMECEREMGKRLACLWMARQDGDRVWQGRISGVLSFGVFVELDEAPVEGLVTMMRLGGGELPDDWYVYDEQGQSIVGERTGIRWQVGMPVAVRCLRSDVHSLQIDFAPVDVPGQGSARAPRTRAGRFLSAGHRARSRKEDARGREKGRDGRHSERKESRDRKGSRDRGGKRRDRRA